MKKKSMFENILIKPILRVVLVCFLLLGPQIIKASPILDVPILGGNFFVASDGKVQARFLGSDTDYESTLFLVSPGDLGNTGIFTVTSQPGSAFDLGYHSAGTELVFKLSVHNSQQNYFSGAASRNPDGIAHAMATTSLLDNDLYVTRVGFEDLFNGGDRDFNDFTFELFNVIDPPGAVAEPSVFMLFFCGIFSMVIFIRRRQNGY